MKQNFVSDMLNCGMKSSRWHKERAILIAKFCKLIFRCGWHFHGKMISISIIVGEEGCHSNGEQKSVSSNPE